MPGKYTTNFTDENSNDLGSITVGFIEKTYLIDIYSELPNNFKTPTLWTWGPNTQGQLGDNSTTPKSSPVQTVATGNNWKYVSSRGEFVAAIKTNGTLWIWGQNSNGQLGDNTTTSKSSPVQTVAGGTDWLQISAGTDHMSGIKTDNTLWCWGKNTYGQLGDNTNIPKSSPVQTVVTGTVWKQVSSGHDHTGSVKTNNRLWLWGRNDYGQLGDNSRTHKSSPVQTSAGGTDWKQVSTGYYHTAGIKTDGTLWCWGHNTYGQLGDNTSAHKSNPAQTIANGEDWKQVSAGGYFTAAIKNDGTLWVWGDNTWGQLGDNTSTKKSSPVQTVAGGTNWKQVSAGGYHLMAIKTDGTVWGWGWNDAGEIGDNSVTWRSSPVQIVATGTNWKAISPAAGIKEAEGW
jgi:alpha-tubulin suppressor-like RCC1 family protein